VKGSVRVSTRGIILLLLGEYEVNHKKFRSGLFVFSAEVRIKQMANTNKIYRSGQSAEHISSDLSLRPECAMRLVAENSNFDMTGI
jgi:hypothetical protein